MKEQGFQIKLNVDVSAEEAFKCINNVSEWWTDNMEGDSHQLNDCFTVHFEDIHVSTLKNSGINSIPKSSVVGDRQSTEFPERQGRMGQYHHSF